jgi:hypothetical protein
MPLLSVVQPVEVKMASSNLGYETGTMLYF